MNLLLLLVLLPLLSFSTTIYVAVSSSMRSALEDIAKRFEKERGISIKLSSGSSGNLYRQIAGGAPYDIFVSASEIYTRKLLEKGLASKGEVIARGRLVIFSLRYDTEGFNVLKKASRVAVANPRYAPYGSAAVQALKRTGIYGDVRKKLVYGSNVGQAFQFVVSGGAEYGIVALSLVKTYGRGSYWVVPEGLYAPITHIAVLTNKGDKKKEALEFFKYLKSKDAREVLERLGFEVQR